MPFEGQRLPGKDLGGAGSGERERCPHPVLVPAWDNVAATGSGASADRFVCALCRASFSADEADALRRP